MEPDLPGAPDDDRARAVRVGKLRHDEVPPPTVRCGGSIRGGRGGGVVQPYAQLARPGAVRHVDRRGSAMAAEGRAGGSLRTPGRAIPSPPRANASNVDAGDDDGDGRVARPTRLPGTHAGMGVAPQPRIVRPGPVREPLGPAAARRDRDA